MLRILHNTKLDFIKQWKKAAIGLLLFVLPALVLIPLHGYTYSIEFTGGTMMQVRFDEPKETAEVRAALAAAGHGDAEIATFGGPGEFMIRAQEPEAVAQQEAGAASVAFEIERALTETFGEGSFEEVQREAVSARVSGELRQKAGIAMLIAFALTLVYLAWRFQSRFAVAAVLATLHDLLATFAFMKYMDLEISLFVVGSVLTVIGYSMNDTVVVFDRVRENLKLHRKMPFYDLLNLSVNETLPRTVMTGTTTLACLLALLIFGGTVIRPFAWILTFGILIGTFSSIYVASPLLLWLERKYPRGTDAAPRPKATAAAARA
ncbi:MAG TPA: protein translocase subunit SecF [Gemmatimonadaceae bacterium]|nr:protein translocase subunit SecF [Gemmatimonadaceae bacterium]